MPKLTLNDICQYRNENMLSTDLSDNVYISTETMQPNREGISSSDIVTPTTKKVKAFYPGDILVSNIRPYFKKIWRATFAGGCSNDVLVFSPKCNSEYLYWLLSTDSFFNYMMATSKGTKMPRGDKKAIMKYIVPDHSDKEQRQIASFLNPLQNKIALNNRINDYLAELGKMIWAQTAKQAAKTVKIAEVAADIVTGKTPSTKKPDNYGEEYPFITIPDMHSAVWLCSTERCLSEVGNSSQPKKLVQRGSVLVSCIATVGLVGIVQKPSHFNQQINAVIPANEDDEFYLYYAMHSIKQELLGIGATGSATLNVNKGAFSNIEIPWPERSAMDTYVRTVEPLFKAIEANTLESLRLQELRDTLLPKLMSGEIDVSKVEI